MVAYFGNAWNWVDWVNLGLPLAKFLSDAAARLLGFQMLPTRWAHALWGFMTVTLALRFFRYASCLSQFKLIFNTLQRAARGIRNFLTTAAAILSFLAVAGHMMFGHFSPRFRSLLTSRTPRPTSCPSLFEIPDEIAVTPVLGYLLLPVDDGAHRDHVAAADAIIPQAFDDVRTDMSHDSFIDRDGEVLEALKGWRKIAAPAGTSAGSPAQRRAAQPDLRPPLPGIGGMATADLLEALMLVAEEDDETELRELRWAPGSPPAAAAGGAGARGARRGLGAADGRGGRAGGAATPSTRSRCATRHRADARAAQPQQARRPQLAVDPDPVEREVDRRASAPTSAVSEREAEEASGGGDAEATFHRSAARR